MVGSAGAFRFGKFEFHPSTGELRKGGTQLRVPDQSLAILALLLERPGEVVTREDIRQRLWPHGTIVEFEHSVNSSVHRLREALSDTAGRPRYVETLPKRGYRFVGPVETGGPTPAVAHYRILGETGRGAMGIVYRAEDTRLGRQVALKVLQPEVASDPQRKARLIREARAASALNHPNIVTIYDVGAEGGRDFIAMEYVDGKPLTGLIPGQGMPPTEAVRIAVQIADALARAHAAGIVHRDLKPGNIMVTGEGRVKLLDFGIAQFNEGDTAGRRETVEGTVIGTASYMSPEQAEGRPVDARGDVFSFGSVLYEMVTGRRAFERESYTATLAAILHYEPAPLSEVAPAIPEDLERAISRCLQKDAAARWQTMSDLKAALENLGRNPAKTVAISKGPTPTARGLRATLWILGFLVVAGAASAVWLTRVTLPPAPRPLVHLTYDSGYTGGGAISPDGKLVSYSSDRGGDNLQIWVQHIDGRQPIRLTHDEQDNEWPTFSPDGSRIFFESRRKGGGIFSIDTLGGDMRMLVGAGFRPSISPDGSRMAYITTGALWNPAKMFIVPIQGGHPMPFQPGFRLYLAEVARPVWSPDGNYILFPGVRADGEIGRWQHDIPDVNHVVLPGVRDEGQADWYVGDASMAAPEAVATGFITNVAHPGFGSEAYPCAWVRDYVYYYEGNPLEGVNLYRVGIAPGTWKIKGPAERLTSGPGMHLAPSISGDGRMVFTNFTYRPVIWSVPLEANGGAITGERRQISGDETANFKPSVSRDGTKVAFYSFGGVENRRIEVRLRDGPGGAERVYPARNTEVPLLTTRLSPDGSLLAWVEDWPGKQFSFVTDSAAGETAPVPVCIGCRVLGFFSGGDLLVSYGDRKLVRQARTTGVQSPLGSLASPSWIAEGALSPDDAWVALQIQREDWSSAIQVAPVRTSPAAESDWITLAAGPDFLACPRWSPDGHLVYYFSDRDGHTCIWVQRVEAVTKRPVGAPFAVLHEHRFRYYVASPQRDAGFDVANGSLVYMRAEITGNIWMTNIDLDGPHLFNFRLR